MKWGKDCAEMSNSTKENSEFQVKNKILNLIICIVDKGSVAAMSGSTAKIYLVLLRHRNVYGKVWVSVDTIRKESGIGSRNTVFRSLSWLVACGLITKKRGPKALNFVNIYNVILDPAVTILSRRKKRYKKKKQTFSKKETPIPKSDTTPLIAESDTQLLSQKVIHKEIGSNIGSIITKTAKNLSLKEKKTKRKEKPKIDAGEKAWKEFFDSAS